MFYSALNKIINLQVLMAVEEAYQPGSFFRLTKLSHMALSKSQVTSEVEEVVRQEEKVEVSYR